MMVKTVQVKLDDAKLKEIIRDCGQDTSTWVVSDGVEYGLFVEMGTSRRAARPCLVPAFEQHTRDLGRALEQAIERAVSLNDVLGKMAFDIQRDYQQAVPVDTGALKNSIHTEEQ